MKKYKYIKPFGYNVWGNTLGEMWLNLIEVIIKYGKDSLDEKRHRLAIQNIRVKSVTQKFPDKLIEKYGNKENLSAMLKMTFAQEKMYDIDIIPSFSPGAKSYYQRLKNGKMIEFVVNRLSVIPESKKAVIVFPTYEDYKEVLKNHKDDYLPCIVSVQFRLSKASKKYILDTTLYMRSIDAFQKAHGNFIAIAMLSHKIANELSKKISKQVACGFLDGLIADAHIYKETISDAENLLKKLGN